MQKYTFITKRMIFFLLFALLSSCGGGGGSGGGPSNEGSISNPVYLGDIDTRTTYGGQVGADGVSFYEFTASATGTYTIGLTNTQSDLSWVLSFDPTYFTIITGCDSYLIAADEICITPITLNAGDVLYLAVEEWDAIPGTFTLTIAPNTTGGGGEGSIASPINLGNTPTNRIDASVGASGSSYYEFTAGTTGTHAIGLTNTQSDLSWMLFTDSSFTALLDWCDNFLSTNDEICTTPILTSGTTYYLIVDEWDNTAGTFDLTIAP